VEGPKDRPLDRYIDPIALSYRPSLVSAFTRRTTHLLSEVRQPPQINVALPVHQVAER
jgi:hypothetical protein